MEKNNKNLKKCSCKTSEYVKIIIELILAVSILILTIGYFIVMISTKTYPPYPLIF
ncbi:MAG: hypothetical protein ACTSPD_21430 [Promethearchaeota archaeon]